MDRLFWVRKKKYATQFVEILDVPVALETGYARITVKNANGKIRHVEVKRENIVQVQVHDVDSALGIRKVEYSDDSPMT